MSSRAYYFVHPAVGVEGPFARPPAPRTSAELGDRWDQLADAEADDRERAFFSRLFGELCRLWPRVAFVVEYPSAETPRRLAALAETSMRRSNEVTGQLTSRCAELVARSGPTYLQLFAEGESRLAGEPWDGLTLHLTDGEAQALRSTLS